MDEKRKKVETMLRAALQSCKEGVPLSALPSDYRKMTGEIIPFRDLGFPSLRDLLVDMRGVLRVGRNKMGEDVAFAVADQSTAHIESLIARQKPAKPRPMPAHKFVRRYPNRTGLFRPRTTSARNWSNYVKPRVPTVSHCKPYEPNYLQRIPTPPPPPVSTIPPSTSQSRNRNNNHYVPPPRFLKKREEQQAAISVRSESPVSLPHESSRPASRTSSFDTSRRQHSPTQTRNVSFEEPSLVPPKPKYPEPAKTVSFDPSNLVYYEPGKTTRTITYQHQGLDSKRTVSFKPSVAYSHEPQSFPASSPEPSTSISPPLPVMLHHNPVVNNIAVKSKIKTKRTETCRQLIDEFARFHGEQPIYRSLPVKTKKSGIAYVSTLILLDIKYYSYPDEKPTAEEAEEVAASKAVKALNIIPGQYQSGPVQTPVNSRQQISTLVERLYEIIKEKPNGIWHTKVPNFYEEIYRESLPKDWLQILKERCPDLCINNTVDENFILYPETARPHENATSSASGTSRESARADEPEPLCLPGDKFWDVYVCNISEPLTVSIRLVDYSDKYDYLAKSMDDYYSIRQLAAKQVVVGDVYAVKSEGFWYRVRVLSVSNGNLAQCYFLDNGDTESIDVKELNVLMPSFFSLPYQAIQCQLADLDQFVQNSAVYQKLLDLAFGKILVAKVVSWENPITFYLYDTSTEEDININEMLVEVGNIHTMTPHLPNEDEITQGYLTHVTDEGDLFIQVKGPSLGVLEDLTTDIAAPCEDRKGLVTTPSPTKMYCAKFTNGLWYRAYVRNILPDDPNMVTVWYVDYGNTAVIPISDICEVDDVTEFLTVFPHQALRCRLYDVPSKKNQQWTKEASAFLRELVPEGHDQPLIIKVVKRATDTSLPQVNLFQRILPSLELIFVNQTLITEERLFDKPRPIRSEAPLIRPSNESLLSSRTFQAIPDVALSAHMFETSRRNIPNEPPVDSNQTSLPPLLPPEVPNVGQTFDVTVTSAAHPHNFMVQPWSSSVFLDDLMDEMQNFYNSEDNICDMHECLLKEGEFYASKSKDGQWYRTSVIRRMADQTDTVWVYFVDYGDYDWMTLNDLQPLWKRFRSLPFQAIRASLADVVPVEGDWDPMDCVNFQKMIVEKQFVSIVKTRTVDKSNSLGGYELGIRLIDTSSDRDVYIHDLLIEKGKAKLVKI